MKISTALPLILVLPIIGFVGYQAVTQFQESEAEKAAAAKASAPLLDDSAAAAQAAAAADPGPPQPEGPGPVVVSSQAAAAIAQTNSDAGTTVGRDVADVRRRVMLGSRGTYIDEILAVSDSGLARWPDRLDNPLRVWVADGKGIPGWDPHYPDRGARGIRHVGAHRPADAVHVRARQRRRRRRGGLARQVRHADHRPHALVARSQLVDREREHHARAAPHGRRSARREGDPRDRAARGGALCWASTTAPTR